MSAKALILVADDDDLVRGLMRTVLANSGYAIVEAIDGEDAVQKCLGASFDLLLMDHNMPRLSGWDACLQIRREKPDMKVLLLSGAAQQPEVGDTQVRFLPKPFENHELVSAVGQMLRG
jgi:CheY-like chemotaxis protein